MNKREIIISQDSVELCRQAADKFVGLARHAIIQRDRFAVALSGGSTPRGLYALLATPEYRGQVSWARVHLFWGDERCVPPDHEDSNFRMVRHALLSQIDIPANNVHRMAGEKDGRLAAAEYEQELKAFFHLAKGKLPRFDLIFLGLGEDGHTASLFPGTPALIQTEHLVTHTEIEKLNARRLTLTFPVLNGAAEIVFLVAGASKKNIVAKVLEANSSAANFPAAQIQPCDGRVTWFISRDAASALRLGPSTPSHSIAPDTDSSS